MCEESPPVPPCPLLQAAYEIREASERRLQQQSEALAAAEARAAELEEAGVALQRAAEGAQRAAAKAERALAELQEEHQALQEAHEKVGEWAEAGGWVPPGGSQGAVRRFAVCFSQPAAAWRSAPMPSLPQPNQSPHPPPLQLQEAHSAAQRDHDRVVADSAVMLGDLQVGRVAGNSCCLALLLVVITVVGKA